MVAHVGSCWGHVASRWLQVGATMAQDRSMLAQSSWPQDAFKGVQRLPNPFVCIRTHRDASKKVQTCPHRSEHVRKPKETCESFTKSGTKVSNIAQELHKECSSCSDVTFSNANSQIFTFFETSVLTPGFWMCLLRASCNV